MGDIVLFILLFVAIAAGWMLGRRGLSSTSKVEDATALPSQYYKGLNYLLDGRPDGAIDEFIDSLEVNAETLDTHIALGNLLRRNGEVDRAIRIHENLLSRPSLPSRHLHHAHLELARDYISAGLLDRAESLLQDLVVESAEQKITSLKHLLEIYQDEKDWEKAIEIAKGLLPRKSLVSSEDESRQVLVALSHYLCETAETYISANDTQQARSALKEALEYDKKCVRASLLLAEIEARCNNFKLAIKALKRVRFQDSEYIPETVELLHKCYLELGDRGGLHSYLRDCMDFYPSVTLLIVMANDIRQNEGDESAAAFIGKQLKTRPSLRGLSQLIELHVANAVGVARENLELLRQLVDQLILHKPSYRCNHCGFSGRQLHWLCPGCKQWGAIKTIRGAEGD
tara:strand:- start:313 stop:1512 length:1200 start_codon:yes stop_codon:yes gene_type:complete